MKRLLSVIAILVLAINASAEEKRPDKFAFAPILMQSTFKISHGNSIGTAFLMVHQVKDQGKYILITAKHVLKGFQSDVVTLDLRKRNNDDLVRFPHKIQIRKDGKPLWVEHQAIAHITVRLFSHTTVFGIRFKKRAGKT
jgi:hypothetical protein